MTLKNFVSSVSKINTKFTGSCRCRLGCINSPDLNPSDCPHSAVLVIVVMEQAQLTPPPWFKCSINAGSACPQQCLNAFVAQTWRDWAWFSLCFSWCSQLERVSNGQFLLRGIIKHLSREDRVHVMSIRHFVDITEMFSHCHWGKMYNLLSTSIDNDSEMQYWTCGYRGLCRRFCYAQEYTVGHHGCPRRYR